MWPWDLTPVLLKRIWDELLLFDLSNIFTNILGGRVKTKLTISLYNEGFVKENCSCIKTFLSNYTLRKHTRPVSNDTFSKICKQEIIQGHNNMIRSITVEPRGQYFMSGSDDGTCKVPKVLIVLTEVEKNCTTFF